MNRRLSILSLGVVVFVVGVVSLIIILINNHNKIVSQSPEKKITIVDKDTGQSLEYYPNQNSESPSQAFFLLNSGELSGLLGPGQYDSALAQIQAIITTKTGTVPAAYAKVMPGTAKWDLGDDVIKATIKQDSPATQFVISIKLTGPGTTVVTSD